MNAWRRTKRPNASQQPSLPGLFAPFAKFHRLSTPQEQALDTARTRLMAAFCVFALAWTLIAGRLAELTLLNDTPEQPVAALHAEPDESSASRADVTDRNGTVLATSVPTSSLCVDSKRLLNADEAAIQLLSVLPDLDAEKLHEDLHSNKRCAVIRRHLTPRQTYSVNKLGIAGLEFQPDEARLYPAGNVMAQVVGYTDIDNQGLAGAEKEFDHSLAQQPEPVALSLDLRLQTILRNELAGTMAQFHAIGATGLIMDISTGEILSMVSLPDFDPARAGTASESARFNRSTLGVYEMGSTFKIFNTALTLDTGLVHLGDTFNTVDPIEIGNQTIRDFENQKRWLNVTEIFAHSSNIGAAHMAEKLGAVRQRAFLAKLGLTEKVPLEVPEVGTPLVPAAKDWGTSTIMTTAFGHGIAVNSVQLAAAIATIMNDGIPVTPTLLKHTAGMTEEKTKERVISARTSAIMRGLMRVVVTQGTGKGNDVPGYLLGGKTGTADKLVNGRYAKNSRLSSFVGVFPMNAPRYLVFAMLDDPKGDASTYGFATGGKIAAPVVSRVVGRIGPLLGMAPLDPDMAEAAERQLLKPLGTQLVDGVPVDEGSNYASNESHRVQ